MSARPGCQLIGESASSTAKLYGGSNPLIPTGRPQHRGRPFPPEVVLLANDKYDNALAQAKVDPKGLTKNQLHDLERLQKEHSSRGREARDVFKK